MEKSVFGSFAGINPRLIPFRIFLFLSQKRIRVISRNNPILDFTKEMHPVCYVNRDWSQKTGRMCGNETKRKTFHTNQ